MKKSIFTTLLLMIDIAAFGDNNGMNGMALTNLVSDSKVPGSFLNLNANTTLVDQFNGGQMILLYQQNKSEAMVYNSIDQNLSWKKDNTGGIFQMTQAGLLNSNNCDIPINGNAGFFTSLDNVLGNHVWTRYILPVYVDDSANVVFGYHARWNSFNNNIEFNNDNMLCAYRLSDGKELWKDTISHYTRWGWNNVMHIQDSGNYLVWADKLMLINPQTGIIKSINVNSGRYGVPIGVTKRDYRTNRGNDADYAFTPYVDRGYYTGLKSNVIFKDGKIYLADEEELYCLDEDLNVIWYSQLPKEKTSAMKIKIDGDKITLLSAGLAYLEGCSYPVGKPFVAQFDVCNGKQEFLKYLDISGKISDAYLGDGKAFFLTNNGLSVVSDFPDPSIRSYDKTIIGRTTELGKHPMYELEGNRMLAMGTEGNELLLVGKNNDRVFDGDAEKVIKVEPKNILYRHPGGEIYICRKRDKKGNDITDEPSDLVVASTDGNVKAHFNTEFNGAFYDEGLLTIVMKTGIFTAKL